MSTSSNQFNADIMKVIFNVPHTESQAAGPSEHAMINQLMIQFMDQNLTSLWKDAFVFSPDIGETLPTYILGVMKGCNVNENDATSDFCLYETYLEYGCLVLSQRLPFDSLQVKLVLIGLDNWTLDIHSSTNGREHTSVSNKSFCFDLGMVGIEELPEFKKVLAKIMTEGQSKTREERHAGNSGGGHQKTPTFIQLQYEKAICGLYKHKNSPGNPRGGLTDVGLHTGGKKRNTSYPLLRALLEFFLQHFRIPNKYHIYLVEIFHIEFCFNLVENYSKDIKYSVESIDTIMVVLKSISHAFEKIKRELTDTRKDHIAKRCTKFNDDCVKLREDHFDSLSKSVGRPPLIKDLLHHCPKSQFKNPWMS
jgi:hypothetical protein